MMTGMRASFSAPRASSSKSGEILSAGRERSCAPVCRPKIITPAKIERIKPRPIHRTVGQPFLIVTSFCDGNQKLRTGMATSASRWYVEERLRTEPDLNSQERRLKKVGVEKKSNYSNE